MYNYFGVSEMNSNTRDVEAKKKNLVLKTERKGDKGLIKKMFNISEISYFWRLLN